MTDHIDFHPAHYIDVALMRKVLEHITAHPEQHDQGVWGVQTECGTTACMAGWTVILAGGELKYRGTSEANYCAMPDGRPARIEHAAMTLLGLDDQQAADMFMDAGTVDDLWAMAEAFTHGELKRPSA